MQILYGRSTLFDAYQARLLKKICSVYPAIARLETADVYFLDLSSPLNQSEEKRLAYLLHPIATPTALSEPIRAVQFHVVPRQGTVSAWSSKASDILHICGLGKVLRIERGRFYRFWSDGDIPDNAHTRLASRIYDRMTEEVSIEVPRTEFIFEHPSARPLNIFEMGAEAYETLAKLNADYGFAMSEDELQRLAEYYRDNDRSATDVELMMFAQVNSEHCRHKLFNAVWTVDGTQQEQTLFQMIRSTSKCSPDGILVAYDDNAAVLEALPSQTLQVDGDSGRYVYTDESQALSIKVETHNHPTAISPAPGAATGAGGEIRDEVATGRSGKSKAGITGFCVSKLGINTASFLQLSSSSDAQRRDMLAEQGSNADGGVGASSLMIASPLQIMMEAPIGSASFNNEFGRPGICGYFREFEYCTDKLHFGYHKPIMLAGGLGSLFKSHIEKRKFCAVTPLVVIGGAAMRIGIGGGSASSVGGGQSSEDLDFASVQRDNAEMQRRCQEVINKCIACGDDNPILSIHDVGAGGLSNALPELVHDAGLGAVFELEKIPYADKGMSPMEVWCNESQERYVLAIDLNRLDAFLKWCARERCPVAVVGRATDEQRIVLLSDREDTQPIDMPMDVLFGYLPPVHRSVAPCAKPCADSDELAGITLDEAAYRVLSAPTVASKSFLITIGDRSVGGLVARDQMVGPWQVPVADVAVSAASFTGYAGEAMAVGERPPIALLSPQASARVAVAEAILNMLAADVATLKDIKLSANWMVAADETEQALALFKAVEAIATDLCPALGIAIPVGKDSVSMRMSWDEAGERKRVISPLSVVISAFAPVADVRNTLTPQLSQTEQGNRLFFIDLAAPGNPLGGACLMQAFDRLGNQAVDLKDATSLKRFAALMRALREQHYVLSYHDRSDGGLFACLSEMMFAGGCGIACRFDEDEKTLLRTLFSEGPGAVVQLNRAGVVALPKLLEQFDLSDSCREIGTVISDKSFVIESAQQKWCKDMFELKRWWAASSAHIRALRDNPKCAQDELTATCDPQDPGLSAEWCAVPPTSTPSAPHIIGSVPKFAILREQGVNGHVEMAAAFECAGFEVYDVLMNDLLLGQIDLNAFDGMAVCGGFSYGDVLGAGVGWASAARFNDSLREMFEIFFARENTLTLGVCNGCQMLSHLKEIIPGSSHWQAFEGNQSEVFESRLVQVEITPSPSVFLAGMEGARLPIVVAHGEGRMNLTPAAARAAKPYTCLRYIDNQGHANPTYPYNPNGSTNGITGLCNTDGRVTIMMPHPERCFRSVQLSWHPPQWGEDSPWMQLFRNACAWYR